MRRSSAVLGAGLVAAALAVPSDAAAVKRFEGKTQQGRTVKLTIGDDGLLQSARINWVTKACSLSGSRFQHLTGFRPPFDSTTADAFTDAGSFTEPDKGGFRSRVTVTFSGSRAVDPANPAAETWSGTFSAKVVVRKRGKVVDRCTRKSITWSASPA